MIPVRAILTCRRSKHALITEMRAVTGILLGNFQHNGLENKHGRANGNEGQHEKECLVSE